MNRATECTVGSDSLESVLIYHPSLLHCFQAVLVKDTTIVAVESSRFQASSISLEDCVTPCLYWQGLHSCCQSHLSHSPLKVINLNQLIT